MAWLKLAVPLIFFLAVSVFLWRGLHLDPRQIGSPLIDQAAPIFSLASLEGAPLTNEDFKGKVVLLNFFATWCSICEYEHAALMKIHKDSGIPIYGLNYKNNPDLARKWLTDLGNPYEKVGLDTEGKVGIDYGVYGTPETFLIDKRGRIRYKRAGAMELALWEMTILPMVRQLQNETD